MHLYDGAGAVVATESYYLDYILILYDLYIKILRFDIFKSHFDPHKHPY